MTTQTEESVASREAQTDWGSRRSSRRRADFAALKPTLLVVGVVIAIAAIAVGVSLTVWSPASAGDLTVSETDYRIVMATSLRAGQHTTALTNKGKQGHELLLFRTDLPANGLPVDANGDVVEESPLLHNVLDSGRSLKAGGTQSLPVKLEPGHYVAVCNLPAHYRLGMRLDLTVTSRERDRPLG
jgi:uncharacterized cupredoxin-like copper-binding protein